MLPDRDRLRRLLDPAPRAVEAPRHAAVAAVVEPDGSLLFIRRSERASDPWSGHVAFPGGRVEPTDPSPRDAAARETWEELGLDLSDADYLGALEPLAPITGVGSIAVYPFVYALDRVQTLAPNGEVHSVHRLSLASLLEGEGRGPMPFDWRGQPMTLPRVDFAGLRLWGMTLRVVDDLLHRLDGRGTGLDRPYR